MDDDERLSQKLGAMLPLLNERQRRLILAIEAQAIGHGGITGVGQASGVSRVTIQKARRELKAGAVQEGPIRHSGGGRKDRVAQDRRLWVDLEELINPTPRGDARSPLRWTGKSTRQLAQALQQRGHQVSDERVRKLLQEADYSLQANAKTLEGRQHPDRDAQFEYLNTGIKRCLAQGVPVVSVDTKKNWWGNSRMAGKLGNLKASQNR